MPRGFAMNRPPLSAVTRYGFAIILVALATVGRLALDPVLGDCFRSATLFFAGLCRHHGPEAGRASGAEHDRATPDRDRQHVGPRDPL